MKHSRLLGKRHNVRLRIASSQEWKCNRCKALLPFTFEVDHIVPLCAGGKDHRSNLQALCPNCHREKTSDEIQEWVDNRTEEKTGISKYFNPECSAFYAFH